MGGSWGKIAARKSAENTEPPGKKKKKPTKRGLPFSISWENTERREKLICTYYTIARKYVDDSEEGAGAI